MNKSQQMIDLVTAKSISHLLKQKYIDKFKVPNLHTSAQIIDNPFDTTFLFGKILKKVS